MNAFYEHHKDSIRFGYRCFDRLLLNGLIQPFQQPERVVGFFNFYRQQYPVSRDVLRDIAGQFQNWVVNRSQKWDGLSWKRPKAGVTNSSDRTFGRRNPMLWSRL
jgi:hypothetical protein